MTRRERAACALALEVLRADSAQGTLIAAAMLLVAFGPGAAHVPTAGDIGRESTRRLLRARLALYLRMVLRAENREPGHEAGRWACVDCGSESTILGFGHPWRGGIHALAAVGTCGDCGGRRDWHKAGPPLWEQAPPHTGER